MAPRRIALIATEPSGDRLAASLMGALRAQDPSCEVFGMAGPRMRAAGCESLIDMEAVAVMGIVEVLARYRELRATRSRLMRAIREREPDVVIGVDAPDFNLGALNALAGTGIQRVQFVSPQVWAWRAGRVKAVARAADLLLTIFPFEAALYEGQPLTVKFVGHPIADEMPLLPERDAARAALALDPTRQWLAVLPGSRSQELRFNAEPFFAAAQRFLAQQPDSSWGIVCPYGNERHRGMLVEALSKLPSPPEVVFREQVGREALTAADLALVASGTATLESLLAKTPAVVGYRMPWLNHAIFSRLVRVPFIAMPNLLSGHRLLPEFVQDAMSPNALVDALQRWQGDPERQASFRKEAMGIHETLRKDASATAARAILARVAVAGAAP